jgi:hypothetical protein
MTEHVKTVYRALYRSEGEGWIIYRQTVSVMAETPPNHGYALQIESEVMEREIQSEEEAKEKLETL